MAERAQKERMLAGELYDAMDPELVADRRLAATLLQAYNASHPDEAAGRTSLLRDLLGSVGANAVLRPPFQCDYGYNIHLGRDVFVNFGAVFLDVARIEIGDGAQIGPYAQLYAADHPRDPALRRKGLESGRPVRIGRNVWIGGGAIVLPGVTVGDDAIVGAGSVVTRDVPPGATVAGNPARVICR
jgi:maltose O-acetyltransferase